MLSRHTANDPAVNRRKSYQPTISHYLPYYADCCFLGASKASADDLDTFQTITLRACDCNIVATRASQFATPAKTVGVRTQRPAVLAAAVPVAASELCVLPPTLPILPAAGVELGRAFGSGRFLHIKD